jgi:hypothetical protein
VQFFQSFLLFRIIKKIIKNIGITVYDKNIADNFKNQSGASAGFSLASEMIEKIPCSLVKIF